MPIRLKRNPSLQTLISRYTLAYCDELLRADPSALKRLEDIALERTAPNTRPRLKKKVLAQTAGMG
jgi:hypothetical protein